MAVRASKSAKPDDVTLDVTGKGKVRIFLLSVLERKRDNDLVHVYIYWTNPFFVVTKRLYM